MSYTLGNFLNNLTLTGTRAINGTGNSLDNIITGNSANNVLDGRGGIDTMIGGTGDDIYIVDSTNDVIVEYSNGGTDTVQSSVSYTLPAYVNNLTLTGTASTGGGNIYNNIITGNGAANTLYGDDPNYEDGGNDTLYGRGGNDTLYGREGDRLFGEAGNDYLDGGGYPYFGTEIYMDGGDGNDTLYGYFANMYGGNGNDSLSSAISSNLYGGNGNDTLTSSEGEGDGESMNGGAGADRFLFNTPVFNGYNVGIGDFVVADDTINVSADAFGGGLTPGAAIAQAQFTLGSSASNASQRFIYDKFNTGVLFFDVDGIGGTEQKQVATLSTGLDITNNNIVVVA